MAGNVSRAIEGAEAGFVVEVRNKVLLVTLLIPIDNFVLLFCWWRGHMVPRPLVAPLP